MSRLTDALESVAGEMGDRATPAEVAALSTAISLKRIADALASLGSTDLGGIHNQITHMAWEAGRSFAAGNRTG